MSNISMRCACIFGALPAIFFPLIAFTDALTLSQQIASLIQHRGITPDQTGVAVVGVHTGKRYAAINADVPLNPASCTKIATAAAALSLLGPGYQFETDLLVDQPLRAGRVQHLYIKGRGDPSLVSETLWRMVQDMKKLGLKTVAGDIVVDDSFFASHDFPRRAGNDERAYSAKTSAVSLNFNSFTVVVAPGDQPGSPALVSIEPPSDRLVLVNRVQTGGRLRLNVGQAPTNGDETVTVTGTIPLQAAAQSFYRSVSNPSLYAGSVFKAFLVDAGVAVAGRVRQGSTPAGAHLLWREKSKPLSLIVRDMNKYSNNFIAEQIVKHLGGVVRGAPATTEKGVAVLADFLASIGIPASEYSIQNGSGLSNVNRLTANHLIQILTAAHRNFSISADFISSFPILGIDGTLRRRQHEKALRGVLRAKTGSLNGVSSLAGFIPMANGDLAAFAILTNALKQGGDHAHDFELRIVSAIANGQ